MDSRPVPPEYMKAGSDYLEALRSLGLAPDFLGWGWETPASQWLLVLVTSIIDAGGPLALNRLLFQAYNAKATPKEISPFIVRVFSPEVIPDDFYLLGEHRLTIVSATGDKEEPGKIVENVQRVFLGTELEMINSYQNMPMRRLSYHQRRENWNRFRRNVEKLAA